MIIFLFSVLEDQTTSDHLKIYFFLIHLEKISKVTCLEQSNGIARTGKHKGDRKCCHSSLSHTPQPNVENGPGLLVRVS